MAGIASLSSLWDRAACRAVDDPEIFFPVSSAGAGLSEIARAKAVCSRCSVREQCLEYAVETRQVHGVWGGASENERRAIAGRRRRDLAGREHELLHVS